jgi:transposase
MRAKTFVGLDVHRKLVVATAVNPLGKKIRQSSFGPRPTELTKFLTGLPKPTKVVLEACPFWERYYEAAVSTGAEVVVSNPRNTRLIAESSLKSDKVDSSALANLLRLNAIPLSYVPPPEIRALRKLYVEHRFYTQVRASISKHAYARLAERGIDYAPMVLQHKPQREKFRRLDIPAVDIALDALDDSERRCRALREQIHSAFLKCDEAQLLESIPGVGELTAIGLVGYLCPIERFRSIDKLTSYVGLCPTTRQSADTLYHGRLKDDCNRILRSLLVTASWTHRLNAPADSVAKYTRRIVRRRGKMRGSIAGAHKLLRIMYAILKERRAYSPRAPEGPASKQPMRVPRRRIAAVHWLRGSSLGPRSRLAAPRATAH